MDVGAFVDVPRGSCMASSSVVVVSSALAFMAVNGMVLRLGQTLGPLVIGAALGLWGLDGAFYSAATIAIALFALLTIMGPQNLSTRC